MTKVCLEYYVNVYIQHFPGEHAPGPPLPLAEPGFAMLDPPPQDQLLGTALNVSTWAVICTTMKALDCACDNY